MELMKWTLHSPSLENIEQVFIIKISLEASLYLHANFHSSDDGVLPCFDCFQSLNPTDDFPVRQRLLLQDPKREAYKHKKEWIRVLSASDALPMDASASASSPTKGSIGPSTSSQHPVFLLSSGSTYIEVEAPFPFIAPSTPQYELWPGQQELETAPLFQSSVSMLGNMRTLGSEAEPAVAHHLSRLYSFGGTFLLTGSEWGWVVQNTSSRYFQITGASCPG